MAFIPTKHQVVANRCIIGNGSQPGGGNYSRLEARYKHIIGNANVSQLRLAVPSFLINPNGEQLLGNNFSWEAALELISPVTYQPAFAFGTRTIGVTDGQPYALTDPIPYDFAANDSFWLRQGFITPSTSSNIPVGTGGSAVGDAAYISAAASSQVFATGAMSQPSGGTGFSQGIAGMILGIPSVPLPAVAYVGDSIADSTGETGNGDANGNIAFIARGLNNVNGFSVPYVKETVGSWTYGNATIDKSPRLRNYWPFVTHLVCELGTNDAANNATFSQLTTYATAFYRSAKRIIGPYGVPLQTAACTLMPRTTSTDSWATGKNQTPVNGFQVGGVRDQFNRWLKAQVGNGLIDAVIDSGGMVEDPAVPGAWITTGTANYPTTDGIHPSTAIHIIASNAVNSWAQGITAI